MRRGFAIGLVAVGLIVVVGIAGSAVWAQGQRRTLPSFPNVTLRVNAASEIGVSVRDLTTEEVESAGLQRPGGAWVEQVREESPASRAGLQSGDVVVEFDGERVRGSRHLARLVHETPAGRAVRSTVVRDGSRTEIDVTPEADDRFARVIPELGRRLEREFGSLQRDFPFDLERPELLQQFRWRSRGRVGVMLMPLTDQLASFLGVNEGVLVSSVAPESPADRAGLLAGDVITAIDGTSVGEVADVTRGVRAARDGAPLEFRVVREKRELAVEVMVPSGREGDSGGRTAVLPL